jgi:dihydroxyacetone kinase
MRVQESRATITFGRKEKKRTRSRVTVELHDGPHYLDTAPHVQINFGPMFVGARARVVDDALRALVLTSPGLCLLDGLRVVVRRDIAPGVAVLSGGGSGHEPAHAGLVGPGLLSGAICGDVFASPSVAQVLAAIRHVSAAGATGVLLVVKNYTGDRLNFGLAIEQARSRFHIACDMVIVDDDVTTPNSRRGLAGTLFVHKLAGHLAERGATLEVVCAACREAVAQRIRTIGASLSGCDMPGAPPATERRVPEGLIEIGLGIHGEKGCDQVRYTSVEPLVEELTQRLAESLESLREGPLACIVNNLGSCSGLEMACVTSALLSTSLGRRITLMANGRLCTALNMHGFSISVAALTPELEEALSAPADPALVFSRVAREAAIVSPPPAFAAEPHVAGEAVSAHLVVAACRALCANEALLNRLDAAVGDGDCGSTLARGAAAAAEKLSASASLSRGQVLSILAGVCEQMGGSSGAVLTIFFLAVLQKYAAPLAEALSHGLERITFYGGARVGSRSLVDALAPAVAVLSAGGDLRAAAVAARHGAEKTAQIAHAAVGRSAYLNAAALAGHEDPGAVAVALALEAMADENAE